MIGRDTHCDLSVMDEALSAHHARITFHHGQWWLEDLNSTNGTFLNREKLNPSGCHDHRRSIQMREYAFRYPRGCLDDKLSPMTNF